MKTLFKFSLVGIFLIAIAAPAMAQDIILLNKDGEKVGVAKDAPEEAKPATVVPAETSETKPAGATLENGVITITHADGTTEEIILANASSVTISSSSQTTVDENGESKIVSNRKAIVTGPDGVRREITLDGDGGAQKRAVKKSWMIGLNCTPVSGVLRSQLKLEEGCGLVVSNVLRGGPAEKAGIQVNDVLMYMDTEALGTNRQLTENVDEAGANDQSVSLLLLRGGEEVSVSVEPAEREGVRQILGGGGFGAGAFPGFPADGFPGFDMKMMQMGTGLILDVDENGHIVPKFGGEGFGEGAGRIKEMKDRIEELSKKLREQRQ